MTLKNRQIERLRQLIEKRFDGEMDEMTLQLRRFTGWEPRAWRCIVKCRRLGGRVLRWFLHDRQPVYRIFRLLFILLLVSCVLKDYAKRT